AGAARGAAASAAPATSGGRAGVAATTAASAAPGGARGAGGAGVARRVAVAAAGRGARAVAAMGRGLVLGVDPLHCGHDRSPDLGREGAAVGGGAAEVGGHRGGAVGVADPDAGREVLVAAAEPGVAVVLGRPGLAPLRAVAELGAPAGPLED